MIQTRTAIIGKRRSFAHVTRRNPWRLTGAEAAVVRRICQGQYSQQIADELFISPRTLQTHLSNIYDKVDVADRVELVVKILHHSLAREIFFPELQISDRREIG